MGYLAVNHYQALCMCYRASITGHPVGETGIPDDGVGFDQYGYFRHVKDERYSKERR